MSEVISPQGKRRRTATACTQCRGRRTKCDGAYPRCAPCLNLGFECSFASSSGSKKYPVVVRREDYDRLADRLLQVEKTLAQILEPQIPTNLQANGGCNPNNVQNHSSPTTSVISEPVAALTSVGFLRHAPHVAGDTTNKLLFQNLSPCLDTAIDAALIEASIYSFDARARWSTRVIPTHARILPGASRVDELIDIWSRRLSPLYPIIQVTQIYHYYGIAMARGSADILDAESEAQLGLLNAVFVCSASATGCWEEAAGYYMRAGILLSDAGDLGHQDTLTHGKWTIILGYVVELESLTPSWT